MCQFENLLVTFHSGLNGLFSRGSRLSFIRGFSWVFPLTPPALRQNLSVSGKKSNSEILYSSSLSNIALNLVDKI